MTKTKKFLRTTASQHQERGADLQTVGRDLDAISISVNAIRTGNNPRGELGDLTELTSSVKRHGVLQSVLLMKSAQGSLLMVAGHRRLEAAKQAGLESIPARIVQADEDGAQVVALVENIQRESLEPISEISGVARLVHIFDGDQVELAAALGKSKSYVSKCLRAAEFIRENEVSARKLSRAMLFELAYSPNPKASLESVVAGQVTDSKAVAGRKPSGAVPGGRYVTGALQFKERKDGGGFSLRLNFDGERTPAESREKIIATLEGILKRLRSI